MYAGYSTLNQKLDEIHSVTAPQIISSADTRRVNQMVDFTSLIEQFGEIHPNLPLPWKDDSARTRNWAQRLCTEYEVVGINRIEQMTFALTCVDPRAHVEPIILGSHVDHLNDPLWPEVFCLYRHFFDDDKLYRIAAIAYSRSIIGKYEFKDVAYSILKTKISCYVSSPSNANRIHLSLGRCVPECTGSYRSEDGILFRTMVPFLDKAGFYSGFADAILHVWDGSDCERACELLIIVGWISTATSFQKVLSRWKISSFRPDGIWTVAYLEETISRFGGLTNGPGPRTQPWMNFALPYGSLICGLNILRDSFAECRRQCASEKESSMPYAVLHRRIKTIFGVGSLGAQHVIGVASLIGIIPCFLPEHCNDRSHNYHG